MASQGSKSKSRGSSSSRKSSNGRRSSSGKSRSSSNGSSSSSRSRSSSSRSRSSSSRSRSSSAGSRQKKDSYEDYSVVNPKDIPDGPDVLIDVPVVKVDVIDFELDDLRAQIAVRAEVKDMVQLSVGADVSLGKVELKIEGVEAQALLKARLDNVSNILERVALTLDRNPKLLESVGKAVGAVNGEIAEAVVADDTAVDAFILVTEDEVALGVGRRDIAAAGNDHVVWPTALAACIHVVRRRWPRAATR